MDRKEDEKEGELMKQRKKDGNRENREGMRECEKRWKSQEIEK